MSNNEWQPAVLLPLEKMCKLHRTLFESTAPLYAKEERAARVGMKIKVRYTKTKIVSEAQDVLPMGKCIALEASDGRSKTVLFSCEVSTKLGETSKNES